MAKAEWGVKRTCQSCGNRFYDLRRDPIVCPKCGAQYDPLALVRPRRLRAAAAVVVDEPEPAAKELETELEEEVEPAAEDEAEDEGMIEDASELGEDEDDVSEVIENVEDEER